MANYDASVHGKSKLGMFPIRTAPKPKPIPSRPIVPGMPTGAQVRSNGVLHIQIGGMYLTGMAIGCLQFDAPDLVTRDELNAAIQVSMNAIKAQPEEPSYSGTGSDYYHLDVNPHADSKGADLMAGGVRVFEVIVDPEVKILSTDEPIQSQIGHDDDEDDHGDEN